jgi:hypothetical protein
MSQKGKIGGCETYRRDVSEGTFFHNPDKNGWSFCRSDFTSTSIGVVDVKSWTFRLKSKGYRGPSEIQDVEWVDVNTRTLSWLDVQWRSIRYEDISSVDIWSKHQP